MQFVASIGCRAGVSTNTDVNLKGLPVARYIVAPSRIVACDNICGTYCRPKAYIVTGMKFVPSHFCVTF